MPDEWFYRTNELVFGPVTQAVIRDLISQRVLLPGDFCRANRGQWHDVSESPWETAPSVSMSGVFQESKPWAYLTGQGLIGPISTGQLLGAVQSGQVGPRTVIRLLPSVDWIAAEKIEGLTFPRSNSEPDSIVTSPCSIGAARDSEMRKLFAECISRQSESLPRTTVHRQSESRDGIDRRLGGAVHAISRIVGSGLESIGGLMWSVLRSRVAWGFALLLIAGWCFPLLAKSLATQGQAYATLNQIADEMNELRTQHSSPAEWLEFQTRAERELRELVPGLERRADINDKASMSLLWLARDYLPAAIQNQEQMTAADQAKLDQHLAIVREEQLRARFAIRRWDPITKVIIAIDVFGLLLVIVYVVRRRLR